MGKNIDKYYMNREESAQTNQLTHTINNTLYPHIPLVIHLSQKSFNYSCALAATLPQFNSLIIL